jgi:hypothetical protein
VVDIITLGHRKDVYEWKAGGFFTWALKV